MKAAMAVHDMPLPELSVLRAFAWLADDHGNIYHSPAHIAATAGVSARAFQRAVADLTALGVLTIAEQGGGRARWNRYSMSMQTTTVGRSLEGTNYDSQAQFTVQTTTDRRDTTPHSRSIEPKLRLTGVGIHQLELNKENKRDTSLRSVAASPYSEAFEMFWEAYGRKGSKQRAWKEWEKIAKALPLSVVMDAVPIYLQTRRVREKGYKQDASTWLAGRGWENPTLGEEAECESASPVSKAQEKAARINGSIEQDIAMIREMERRKAASNGTGDVRTGDAVSRARLSSGDSERDESGLVDRPSRYGR